MEIKNLERIGQGNTAEIYAFEKDKIIKLFREGISKEIAVYEYEKAEFVQTLISNAPKVHDFVQIEGRFGIIYDRVFGKDMILEMLKSIPKINYHSRKLAHLHMDIHEKIVSADEKYSLKNKLIDDIEATDIISQDKKEALKKYVLNLSQGTSLCHFDFHPGNVMIQEKEPIVIDWMTACVGDSCTDVARTYIILHYGQLPNAGFFVGKLVSLLQKHVGKV